MPSLFQAVITARQSLTDQSPPTQRLVLQMDPQFAFQAGQYLLAMGSNGAQIPLSIASIPTDLPALTLLYRSTEGDATAAAMDALLAADSFQVSAAQGDCLCPAAGTTTLLVAGGTGISQVLACARERAPDDTAGTEILWCVDQAADLFYTDELAELGHLTTVIDPRRGADNRGMLWLQQRFATANPDSQGWPQQVLLSGSPAFVYAATDVLLACGYPQDQMVADVYAYAPRQ
ncbi:MAG: hypothetical protein AAF529_10620 [Pseudomonadota bacterium]